LFFTKKRKGKMSQKVHLLVNPCEVCGEKICLGSQGCPVALAEIVQEEELLPKKAKPYKNRKRKSTPPQISPFLRKFRISPPQNGRAEIKIYPGEEDPTSTWIEVTVEGRKKSVTQTHVRVEGKVTLKYHDGNLTKVTFF
jgi:hypothetical protein